METKNKLGVYTVMVTIFLQCFPNLHSCFYNLRHGKSFLCLKDCIGWRWNCHMPYSSCAKKISTTYCNITIIWEYVSCNLFRNYCAVPLQGKFQNARVVTKHFQEIHCNVPAIIEKKLKNIFRCSFPGELRQAILMHCVSV